MHMHTHLHANMPVASPMQKETYQSMKVCRNRVKDPLLQELFFKTLPKKSRTTL